MQNKTVYKDPAEFVRSKSAKHWFHDFNNQDELLFRLAKELYLSYDNPKSFTHYLDEASAMLSAFYDYRYNPDTRRPR